ncbi:hypothetical protein V7S43_001124 [Phytophthora oleae]|uniref:Cyclic nucleotide-binding domain-containing protein n=1 Tax=Phytophthora oleae TaxID=2107226 RepID=A0ABD3G2N4_9STRA
MASRWRKLRAAALILRLLRSRHSVGPSTTRKVALSSDAFPFEPNACCAQSKEELLRRIIAKPIYCQSEVDIKLLAEMLGRCSFNYGLSSASTDALARALHFRVVHDGGILFRQGDAIDETTERFLVVHGSLLVFSNKQAAGNGSQTSRDNTLNRFGECVETCNPGSICGKDAVAGAIVRKTTAMAQTTTLVSFVTKADYLRIARFNVESEAKVLGGVRLLFKKTTASIAPHDLGPEKLLDRKSARLVKRFLHRYECFRTLPHEFLLRLAENLQFHTFNAGETLYPAKDNVPKMFFILSGECCVHLLETTEEGHLKSSAGRKNNSRGFNNVESRPKTNSFDITPGGCICCSETHSQVPGVVPTTHICTLVSGDAFGEMYLSGPAVRFNRCVD